MTTRDIFEEPMTITKTTIANLAHWNRVLAGRWA